MNLENIYMWAKAMNLHDFKALVAKEIDNTPPTVENNNEYVVVNKNDLSSDVSKQRELLIGYYKYLQSNVTQSLLDIDIDASIKHYLAKL